MTKKTKDGEAPDVHVKGLWAFWAYSGRFLGGEIDRVRHDGYVHVPSYMAWFFPCALMPVQTGKDLQATLKALEEQEKAETEKRVEYFRRAREAVYPWWGSPR